MWADQQVYPTVTAPAVNAPAPTVTPRITFKQQTAQLVFAAMFSNPHYAPMTHDELARLAKDAADKLAMVL